MDAIIQGANGGGTASPPMGSAGGGTASPPGTFRGVFLSSWGPMGVEQHHHPWAFRGLHDHIIHRGHIHIGFVFVS